MTCYQCNHEQHGDWNHCQACGALTRANVEAVCRGVAACAVRVDADRVTLAGEHVWRASIRPTGEERRAHRAGTRNHPTRHGAALATFEEAWTESEQRLRDREANPLFVVDVSWSPGTAQLAEDCGDLKAGDMVAWDSEGRLTRAAPEPRTEADAFTIDPERAAKGRERTERLREMLRESLYMMPPV